MTSSPPTVTEPRAAATGTHPATTATHSTAARTAASRPRRRLRLLHPLDRYVLSEFLRVFVVTAIGFPVLVVMIDLTDNLDKYLDRRLPIADIALSYLFWLPETMFMVLPAAVLFATVFTVGALTRNSEITAAKASGISFYRLVAPVFVGAVVAAGIGLALGELAPETSSRRNELLGERAGSGQMRSYFVHPADEGVVYKVRFLDAAQGRMDAVEVERRGSGPQYPTLVFTAVAADWSAERNSWTLRDGAMHVLPDSTHDVVFSFDSSHARKLDAPPVDLTEAQREPEDLNYEELGRYIAALERAGNDANTLRVERMLKIAIPVTCIIIVLFGAPLATSNQRGGAAFGVGISLGTTILFLVLIQLTKAIGGKEIVQPELAAWIPSVIFGTIGLVLLWRVRT
ncbi:MAG TPA: LptF/LptG family permease [Gemmatimonadales bacterium]